MLLVPVPFVITIDGKAEAKVFFEVNHPVRRQIPQRMYDARIGNRPGQAQDAKTPHSIRKRTVATDPVENVPQ